MVLPIFFPFINPYDPKNLIIDPFPYATTNLILAVVSVLLSDKKPPPFALKSFKNTHKGEF